MLGFSFKFWTMNYQEASNDFAIHDSNNFIFQDESFHSLVIVADTIKKIAGENTDIEKIISAMLKSNNESRTLGLHPEHDPIKNEVKVTESADTVVKVEPEFILHEINDMLDESKDIVKKKDKQNSVHTCEQCKKEFKWTKKLVAHLKDCNPDQLFTVMKSLKPNVKRKVKELSLMEDGEEEKPKYPKGPFFCEKCPQVFQKYPGFVSHVNAHELSLTFSKNNTESEEILESEYKLTELRDGVVMKCEKCDLAYSTFQTYKNHMDQYHKKSLSCNDCGLTFTLRNTLVKHKVDYHTLYPKKCDQCPKVLMTAKDFFEHLQSHGKDFIGKTAPCEICGKMLKNKYILKSHVEAVHEKKSGEFACDECGKVLSTKASLEYHRKSVHTQDYPFTCELCGKGFIKYNRMVTCVNNHHGIYKYRCPECDYKTNKLLQFKEHMNSHTKEILFYCPVCNQQSNGTKNLGCHTKQVHKLTLCQAEVLHRTNRFGGPMSEEQIEEMKHKMTSLKSFNSPVKSFENATSLEVTNCLIHFYKR
eukprot:GFUD01001622.1.p1 GENE.GFUD01001622.1~~GFUD01001622.1.p1  ORF type:complete len:532 (+),score=116.63 GFUD01001622.1:82-1677(+)